MKIKMKAKKDVPLRIIGGLRFEASAGEVREFPAWGAEIAAGLGFEQVPDVTEAEIKKMKKDELVARAVELGASEYISRLKVDELQTWILNAEKREALNAKAAEETAEVK